MAKPPEPRCSFCCKNAGDVETLIAGPSVFICDECVDICIEVLAPKDDWRARQIVNLRRIGRQASA